MGDGAQYYICPNANMWDAGLSAHRLAWGLGEAAFLTYYEKVIDGANRLFFTPGAQSSNSTDIVVCRLFLNSGATVENKMP